MGKCALPNLIVLWAFRKPDSTVLLPLSVSFAGVDQINAHSERTSVDHVLCSGSEQLSGIVMQEFICCIQHGLVGGLAGSLDWLVSFRSLDAHCIGVVLSF